MSCVTNIQLGYLTIAHRVDDKDPLLIAGIANLKEGSYHVWQFS